MTDNRDADPHLPAGLRPQPDLTEWDVTVTMARRTGPAPEDHEVRAFTTTMPAVDHKHAQRGGIDFALAINEASGYVWKLADRFEDELVAVPHADQNAGGNCVALVKAIDRRAS